ncbi:MAG TPA: NAD+ synthase [Actinobacteria bacterium]|nr:NAD+ synthase [Actinomycetota bacterium]
MRQLRVALGQYNATVGDLSGNANQVVRAAQEAHRLGAHLLVMPEMFLTGYPIEDLALRSSFIGAAEHRLETLARTLKRRDLGHLTVFVGTLGPRTTRGLPQNIAAVLHDGRVRATYAKQHLPNYGVFDEYRYFAPGNRDLLIEVHGVSLALAICEDLWSDDGPAARAATQGADALVVINGSPYEVNKDDVRRDLCAQRARQANCPLLYANLVGGQDELVFDGDSLAVNADGSVIARAQRFGEEILIVDLSLPDTSAAADRTAGDVEQVVLSADPVEPYEPLASAIAPTLSEEEELYAAIVTGLGDYVRKNGFETVILGLSGGIDSALTATVAVDALGADRVFGVSMPSKYSSGHSVRDAHDLAEALGMYFLSVPIEPMVSAFHDSIVIDGVAAENLQARVRGTTLMALSNQEGHLVLATGNKSELAVGYSTIYGDAVGGFAPLKDIAKTDVWRLAVWRNMVAEGLGETPPIPESSITKPPSAELRPDQLDTDSLPEYALLDEVLADYIEGAQGAAELVREGFDLATVERVLAMVDHAEYKRRQYPPGTKVSPRAFGRDRRLPITSRWRERATGNSSAMPPASGEGATTPEESA